MDAIYIFLIVSASVIVLVLGMILLVKIGFFREVEIIPKSRRSYKYESTINNTFYLPNKRQKWEVEDDIERYKNEIKQCVYNGDYCSDKIIKLESLQQEYQKVASRQDIEKVINQFKESSRMARYGDRSYYVNNDALLAFRIPSKSNES
jgi:hypothetical protein